MKNALDKSRRGNENAHFMFSNSPPPENRAVYKFENFGGVRKAANDNKIWAHTCFIWISKAMRAKAHEHAHAPEHPHASRTRAHTDKYAVLIAFSRQQRFVNLPQYYVTRTLCVFFPNALECIIH